MTAKEGTIDGAPEVLLTPTVLRRMNLYIEHAAPQEISGLGRVVLTDRGNILVTEVCIFEQDASGGHTELDQNALVNWMEKLVQDGGDPSEWKLWWHSHVHGSTFFSGIDDKNMDGWDNGWMVGHVGNTKGEHRFRIDYYRPRATIDKLGWRAYDPPQDDEEESIKKEIREKVKRESSVVAIDSRSPGFHGAGWRYDKEKELWHFDPRVAQQDRAEQEKNKRGNPRKGKKQPEPEPAVVVVHAAVESKGVVGDYMGLPNELWEKPVAQMDDQEREIYEAWLEGEWPRLL